MRLLPDFKPMARAEMLAVLALWILSGALCTSCSQTTSGALDRGSVADSINISPDGKSLVFSGSGAGGNLDIYELSLATLKVTRLTNTVASESDPAFSPDGKSVVFAQRSAVNGPQCLFLLNLGTKTMRQVTRGLDAWDETPSFSRDGKVIVFSRMSLARQYPTPPTKDYGTDVYSIKPDGTDMVRLTKGNYQTPTRPRLAHVGGKLVYAGTVSTASHALGTSIPDIAIKLFEFHNGHKPTLLTQLNVGHFSNTYPYLFADGQHIAYMADASSALDYDLFVGDLSNAYPPRALNVNRYGAQPHSPVVSPDGKYIYFIMGYDAALWRVDSDGAGCRRLATGKLETDPMHWKPGM